jgi:phage tail-like protein
VPTRDTPFGAFNFLVEFNDGAAPASVLGGFLEVWGLSTEITLMDYRQGNGRENCVHKIPGPHKTADITLRRGMIEAAIFWSWVSETRRSPNIQRNIVITLNDEQRNPVVRWKLINARPMKWTGSALAGKVGSEVAIEELVVSAEGFEVEVA